MARFKDRKAAGKSKIVPYKSGESFRQRHERRKTAARDRFDFLSGIADSLDLSLGVTNNGHHWKFETFDGGTFAEWWPSSAKLVFRKKYANGIHVHDAEQVAELLGKEAK